jgi:hypothetical protein
MAQVIVRHLEDETVRRLKERAPAQGTFRRSASCTWAGATLCLRRTSCCRIRQHRLEKARLGELARGDGNAALAALRSGPVGLVDTTPLVERALHLAHRDRPSAL